MTDALSKADEGSVVRLREGAESCMESFSGAGSKAEGGTVGEGIVKADGGSIASLLI